MLYYTTILKYYTILCGFSPLRGPCTRTDRLRGKNPDVRGSRVEKRTSLCFGVIRPLNKNLVEPPIPLILHGSVVGRWLAAG